MATSYFSMQDMQKVWENGGQDAYFALVGSPAQFAGDSFSQAGKGGGQTFVKDATVKGGGFWRKTGQNLMNTGKGALGLGDKALKGTAGLGSRAVKAAGEGVIMGGMQVRRLGRAIGNNPRAAGAVILGGTVLGGGGAYAMSRNRGE